MDEEINWSTDFFDGQSPVFNLQQSSYDPNEDPSFVAFLESISGHVENRNSLQYPSHSDFEDPINQSRSGSIHHPTEWPWTDDRPFNSESAITTSVKLPCDSSQSSEHEIKIDPTMKCRFVKTTDILPDWAVHVTKSFMRFGSMLHLQSAPADQCRLRYESEIGGGKGSRKIKVENGRGIIIQIPDIHQYLNDSGLVPLLRVTRLTTVDAEGTQRLFIHPMPLWIKDLAAKTHHGSLFSHIPPKTFEMEEIHFNINNITMIRSKGAFLNQIKHLQIFNFESFNQTDSMENKWKAKDLIKEFRLDENILHIQVFLFNEISNEICPTDISCETDIIQHIDCNQFDLTIIDPNLYLLEKVETIEAEHNQEMNTAEDLIPQTSV